MSVSDYPSTVGARRGVGVLSELRFAWPGRYLHIVRAPQLRHDERNGQEVALCGLIVDEDDVFPAGQGADYWDSCPTARCAHCAAKAAS